MADSLVKRDKRSAMIVTSSLPGMTPCAGTLLAYSSCQKFTSFFIKGLNFELRDKIDSLTYCASSGITPEKAAEACFRDVGITSKSYGSVGHELSHKN